MPISHYTGERGYRQGPPGPDIALAGQARTAVASSARSTPMTHHIDDSSEVKERDLHNMRLFPFSRREKAG
jgi:hypothetical protein